MIWQDRCRAVTTLPLPLPTTFPSRGRRDNSKFGRRHGVWLKYLAETRNQSREGAGQILLIKILWFRGQVLSIMSVLGGTSESTVCVCNAASRCYTKADEESNQFGWSERCLWDWHGGQWQSRLPNCFPNGNVLLLHSGCSVGCNIPWTFREDHGLLSFLDDWLI